MIFPDLKPIYEKFNGVLLDAYGVFWGGNAFGALPGSKEMMEQLVRSGKWVGVLSNTTQMAEKEIGKLKENGIVQGIHYHFYLTSGEISKQVFIQEDLPFATPNKRFFLAGGDDMQTPNHQSIFAESRFQKTPNIEEADFIYLKIPRLAGKDQTDPEKFRLEMQSLRRFNLPLICSNPDQYAQEGNPPCPVVRQGSLAAIYEQLGGAVFYIGKPHPKSFELAMRSFEEQGISSRNEILMVGDTPETDIRGARAFGMRTALITKTGIMSMRDDLDQLPISDQPDFYIERLGVYEI